MIRKSSGVRFMTLWWEQFIAYKDQFMFGIHIKAFFAFLLTIFIDIIGGNAVVLFLYGMFATLNLLLGMFAAGVYNEFDTRRVGYWFRKIVGQLLVVFLIGVFFHMIYQTSGVAFYLTNWLLIIYSIVDLGSIVDKLDRLGVPVHPVVLMFLRLIRRKVAIDVSNLLQDPEVREHIERALSECHGKECGGEHLKQDHNR